MLQRATAEQKYIHPYGHSPLSITNVHTLRLRTWFLSRSVNSGRQGEEEVAHIYTKGETISCPAAGRRVNTALKCADRKRKAVTLRPAASSALRLV